jgi:hypothetical protein
MDRQPGAGDAVFVRASVELQVVLLAGSRPREPRLQHPARAGGDRRTRLHLLGPVVRDRAGERLEPAIVKLLHARLVGLVEAEHHADARCDRGGLVDAQRVAVDVE